MYDKLQSTPVFAKLGIILTALAAVFFISLIFALPLMWLWNSTMPNLFAISPIDWWTAWKLMVLTSLLFGKTGISASTSL